MRIRNTSLRVKKLFVNYMKMYFLTRNREYHFTDN